MHEMETNEIVMDAVMEVLATKLDAKAMARVNCAETRRKLSKKLFEYLFHELLSTGKLRLPPGLGTFQVIELKKRVAKVYDKKSKTTVDRQVDGKRVVYRPGDTIREFL
jgi:nucleoid DNA-binding protein